MLETCRVNSFQFLHGDSVRIRLNPGPPLFVLVLVSLFRGLCKNKNILKKNKSAKMYIIIFLCLVPDKRCYLIIVEFYFSHLLNLKRKQRKKKKKVFVLHCTSCGVVLLRDSLLLFTAVPSTCSICTEKCYMLFIVVCSMHIWILCAIFCLGNCT